MQHDFQANAAFEGGLKNPKKSQDDFRIQKNDFIVSFMTFYYFSKTIVYHDNNIREWNKVPEKHQFGIYIIIFNNTAKTRIFFWMNIISRKTEHKTLNAN